MTKKFNELTDDERAYYLNRHFKYEVDMLFYSYGILRTIVESRGIRPFNLALEGFLLHARNLRDFLLKKRTDKIVRSTDSIVSDFIDGATWNAIAEKFSVKYQHVNDGLNEAIGKHIAHLTYARPLADDERQKWEVDDIFKFIMELAEEFNNKMRVFDFDVYKKGLSNNYSSSITGYTGPSAQN